jgi:hypothetical protein
MKIDDSEIQKNNFTNQIGRTRKGSPYEGCVGANLRVRPFEIKYLKIYSELAKKSIHCPIGIPFIIRRSVFLFR